MPSIIQQNLPAINDFRIVLSEKVYAKLAECIKLCGLSMGTDNNEYGTILYGYFVPNNIIYFEEHSSFDDYVPKSGSFKASKNMEEELIFNLVNSSKYSCVAHIHTHPFINNEGNRFLSQEDIDYYKTSFNFKKQINGRKIYGFGGLLTIAEGNNPESDDISFVYYDSNTGQLYQIPRISVIMNGNELPLEQVKAEYHYNENSKVEFSRTKFDTNRDREI